MANHQLPQINSNYTDVISQFHDKINDVAKGLDPLNTSTSNLIIGAISWQSASSSWQKWTGTAWVNLSTTYAIAISGNASTATKLATARTIGGVSFDGSASIDLPGVNSIGNQNTTGNASTATKLATARTIGGVSFDGSASIDLPGVNSVGNQNTTGNAGSVTNGLYTVGDQTISGTKTFNRILVAEGTASAPSFGFSSDAGTDTGIYWGGDGNTYFTNNGVKSGEIQAGGNLLMVGNITAYSDLRIKNNLLKIENALNKVCSLTGYTFDRTDITTKRQTGLIAQDILKVLPEAVNGTEDTIYSVAYGSMLGLIVEAIKELRKEISEYTK